MPSDSSLRPLRRWQAVQTALLAVLVTLVAEHPDIYLAGGDHKVARLVVALAPWLAVGSFGYAFALSLADLLPTGGAGGRSEDGT